MFLIDSGSESLELYIWPLYIFFSTIVLSEYLDEAMLIPKNTSVLIRRVPGRPRIRVINQQEYSPIPHYLSLLSLFPFDSCVMM